MATGGDEMSAEDPSVKLVELALSAAGTRVEHDANTRSGPEIAVHALWICACITTEDSPIWLIYERVSGDSAWCRVPIAIEPLTLVDAPSYAGGHADPAVVLRWVSGQAPDPWLTIGSGWGDDSALTALGSRIRNR